MLKKSLKNIHFARGTRFSFGSFNSSNKRKTFINYDDNNSISTFNAQLLYRRSFSTREKIIAPPIVYIKGEEMTRYCMQLILEKWIGLQIHQLKFH